VKDLVLGIDCSTTAAKAIVWDPNGRALAEGRAPIPLSSPRPGFWEQQVDELVGAVDEAVRAALAAGPLAGRLAALCCTHQRETFAPVDEAGRPLGPAIVWMDERATAEVHRVEALLGAGRWHEVTGKPASVTPSLPKILWLAAHEPDAFARARFADVHALVVHALTGRFATGSAAVDPMGLSDPRRGDYDDALLAAVGLGRDRLPEIVATGAPLGTVTRAASARTGLPVGLAVIAGGGDGQIASLGAGLVGPGRAYLNLGTAVVAGVVSDRPAISRAFRTMAGVVSGTFVLESDLKGGAFTTEWMRTRLCGPDGAAPAALDAAAAALPPGAEGLVVVPYWAGVMNPHWDDEASGITVGWQARHGRAHLWRAILEGIAMEQRLALDAIEVVAGAPVEALVALGGGAKSELWCQIVADATGKTVARSRTEEATCLGAGILAAVAAGLHADVRSAAGAMTGLGAVFAPGAAVGRYDVLFREVYRDLYPRLRETLAKLAAFRRTSD